MNDSEKELIRARIPVEDLVGRYTTLRRSGSRFKALCPFHSEKTPSFHVDPERGLWHCYGACSTGGDIFSFLMKVEGIGFRDALERLAEQAGVVLASQGRSEHDVARERDHKDRLREAMAEADRFFRTRLSVSSEALAYCAQRGIDHDARERFAIGFAPDEWSALAQHLLARRIPGDIAAEAGLISQNRRGDGWIDRFRGRLIFPIHDLQERVVGFGGRLLAPAENAPKYLNSPETPLFLKSRTL
ncbi:MAG: DNA primase, partial [Armatimonadota bacterium]